MKIPYTKPSITALEIAFATDAVTNGWGDRCYEYIGKFEIAFAKHLGVKHAIATSSCTGALHMGLAALGIGPGDEVILADTNWIATAAPIVHQGATPVFVDIDPSSWCIDPQKAREAITPRTKAIIATHFYGNLADMTELMLLGDEHGIPVIEDAAEAIGSMSRGRRAGSMGLFGTFSFHGTKTITTGEGGMFVTNDEVFYERVLTLSNHGRARGQTKQFWPDEVGFKYKMSNVQAAIGSRIFDIDELPPHGGSLRFYGSHDDDSRLVTDCVSSMLEHELEAGLQNREIYEPFHAAANHVKNDLRDFFVQDKRDSRTVVGYGTAAKGNTFLSYAGVKTDLLSFICDAAPSKQGKFLPVSHIPGLTPVQLAKGEVDTILILPSNIAGEIAQRVNSILGFKTPIWTCVPTLQEVQ